MINNSTDCDVLNGIRRLLKEKWGFAGRIRATFDRMCGIVTSDTIDTANLKNLALADDRDIHGIYVEQWFGGRLRNGGVSRKGGAGQRSDTGC